MSDSGGRRDTYTGVVDDWPTEEVPLCSNTLWTCHLLLLLIDIYRVDRVG